MSLPTVRKASADFVFLPALLLTMQVYFPAKDALTSLMVRMQVYSFEAVPTGTMVSAVCNSQYIRPVMVKVKYYHASNVDREIIKVSCYQKVTFGIKGLNCWLTTLTKQYVIITAITTIHKVHIFYDTSINIPPISKPPQVTQLVVPWYTFCQCIFSFSYEVNHNPGGSLSYYIYLHMQSTICTCACEVDPSIIKWMWWK